MINFLSVMPCLTKEKAVSVKKNDLSENGETDTLNGADNINETENCLKIQNNLSDLGIKFLKIIQILYFKAYFIQNLMLLN